MIDCLILLSQNSKELVGKQQFCQFIAKNLRSWGAKGIVAMWAWFEFLPPKISLTLTMGSRAQLRMAYVASRCDGKARKHITLRMRDDAMNPYTDSKNMLDHLKAIYSDPNRVTTARHQFRQLYMKTSGKFHDFLFEFLYLAAEAGVADDDWKEELYTKLTTKLQELCISDSFKNSTFQEFSNAVSRTACRLEVIIHSEPEESIFQLLFD